MKDAALWAIMFLCLLVLGLLTFIDVGSKKHDLEIYTCQDIYYIEGFNVTSESTDLDTTFSNKEQLKQFIAEKTSDDCLKAVKEFEN